MSPDVHAEAAHDDIMYPSALPLVLVHLGCIAAIWSGVTGEALALCVTLYWLRIFAIGAGYHRYFSHRSYSTSRVFQFLLAFLAQSSAQKSILWWASKHRITTFTPIPNEMCIHPAIRDLSTATWVGYSAESTTRQTW
jgi:stearoyl-CoA desaturase (Delta-9 desaturase)